MSHKTILKIYLGNARILLDATVWTEGVTVNEIIYSHWGWSIIWGNKATVGRINE